MDTKYSAQAVLDKLRRRNAGMAAMSMVAEDPAPHMRHSTRLHYSKFNREFLPYEIIDKMLRQQAVPEHTRKTGEAEKLHPKMLYWCEENCKGLWMPSPPHAPEYIMFEDETDFTLFLTAW